MNHGSMMMGMTAQGQVTAVDVPVLPNEAAWPLPTPSADERAAVKALFDKMPPPPSNWARRYAAVAAIEAVLKRHGVDLPGDFYYVPAGNDKAIRTFNKVTGVFE